MRKNLVFQKHCLSLSHFSEAHVVKLVDTLLSGGSASRRVGSSPIMRTKGLTDMVGPFFVFPMNRFGRYIRDNPRTEMCPEMSIIMSVPGYVG